MESFQDANNALQEELLDSCVLLMLSSARWSEVTDKHLSEGMLHQQRLSFHLEDTSSTQSSHKALQKEAYILSKEAFGDLAFERSGDALASHLETGCQAAMLASKVGDDLNLQNQVGIFLEISVSS